MAGSTLRCWWCYVHSIFKISVADPESSAFLTTGFRDPNLGLGKEKNPDHISESLEKKNFGLKIPKFIDTDQAPGWKNPDPG
jgi:hypothetical protein